MLILIISIICTWVISFYFMYREWYLLSIIFIFQTATLMYIAHEKFRDIEPCDYIIFPKQNNYLP